eukprot:453505_1
MSIAYCTRSGYVARRFTMMTLQNLQCNHINRSIHFQRSHKLFGRYNKKNTVYLRQSCQFLYQHRYIWIPPVWLRPLIRPLIIIIGGFIGGIILQLWKGQPPQWLLSATAESETASSSTSVVNNFSKYGSKLAGGSVLFIILYLTRLRNPLYVNYVIGISEAKLQLADGQASSQWNAMWDSRSANDSMKTRLTAMEKYLGEAMSAAESDKMSEIQKRIDKIREKGYTNAIHISLHRAEFWAESGEIVKFEQVINQLNTYIAEGGILDNNELERVKVKAYGTCCSTLLANAQTFSNKGDVSNTQKQISEIRNIQYKLGGMFVEKKQLELVLSRAHQHHVSHMINEARKIRENGSRKQAKVVIQQAKQYAKLHNVSFDENAASQVLL